MNAAQHFEDKKIEQLDKLKQTYADIRLNKQLDEHDWFKEEIQIKNVMIRKMTKELAVAEFDVAKYSNVLKWTEIEVASMGEKLKELSKMIDVIQSKTNKAHIIWKSIS